MKSIQIFILLLFTMLGATGIKNEAIPKEIIKTEIIVPETIKEWKVSATVYYPDPRQTDDTPYITADGNKINKTYPFKHRWIAISRDLREHFKFGDTIYVSGTLTYDGPWIVRDLMNKRFKKKIDFLIQEGMPLGKWDHVIVKM